MKVGHDFGRTPMGVHQVAARTDTCTCAPELLELDVRDVACPEHGLKAFLTELIRTGVPA